MKYLKAKFGVDPTPDLDEDGKPLGYFWPNNKDKREETRETRLNNPLIYQSVYQCNPQGAMGRVFDQKDFLYYKQPPSYLESGLADDIVRAWTTKRGDYIVAGWDTAYSPLSQADYTACVIALVVPCDQWHRNVNPGFDCRAHFDIYILDVIRRRAALPELLAMVQEVHLKWRPRVHCIEKKASGISLLQAQLGPEINVEDAVAAMSKRDRALRGVGAGSTATWFRQGRIYFPDDSAYITWLQPFINEIIDFTGESGGVDDQVDALVHLCNHVILASANQIGVATSWSSLDRVDANMSIPLRGALDTPNRDINIFDVSEMLNMQHDDPFDRTCGRCANYTAGFCKVHQMRFISLDTCPAWTPTPK